MTLTKEDIKKIKNVVDASIEHLDAKWERRFQSLETYIEIRFDKNERRLDKIERKIDQLIKTENEDIQVAFKEIQALKLRLKKLESKVYTA